MPAKPDGSATLTPTVTPGSSPITSAEFDNGQPTKDVLNEGTWNITVDPKTGQPTATFTPKDGFTGTPTPQKYTVADKNGLTSDPGELTVTKPAPLVPPTTGDASKTINPNTKAEFAPGDLNTVPGSGDITKVAFDNGDTTKVVKGEGTWTIELVKGQPVAKFTPETDYTGKVTPQPYTVTDSNDKTADGTLNVTINLPAPVPPKTGDKSATTNPGTPVTLNPVTTPGSSPIKSVVFDNGQPTKDVPGEGTWTIKLDKGQPVAVFTPADGFTGKTTAVPYIVTDENGLTATGKLDVTVNTPPTTGDKSAVTNPETPVTLNPVTKPGSAPIKSVVFDNGKPSKDVPGEGTWSIELKDGQPVPVFTPADGFTGKTTPQSHTVTDENGLTATGKLDVTVNKPLTPPTTGDKTVTGEPGKPVTLKPVTTPGSAPIKSVVFDNGQPKKVVPGQGTWTVELKDGQPVVVFTPEPGFKGSPDPQQYTVTDANGKTAKGTLKVTISKPAPAPTSPTTPKAPAAPGKVKPAPAAPAEQPQSILASTGASVGIALVAMLALAAAGLGLRKLSRRNGSD